MKNEQISSLLYLKRVGELDSTDPFFDSLRREYQGFDAWLERIKERPCYVQYSEVSTSPKSIQGLLILKIETGDETGIPELAKYERIMKVCTFKIDAHNTKLGQFFVQQIVREMSRQDVRACYLTVFSSHPELAIMLERYGFEHCCVHPNTRESVIVKDFTKHHHDILKDYPRFSTCGKRCFVLAIKPEYHTQMFPDSIRQQDDPNQIQDLPHTNAIEKIFVSSARGVHQIRPGDLVLIYCMKDKESKSPAYYAGCITTICVVKETRPLSSFPNLELCYNYTSKYNLFTMEDLASYYSKANSFAINMTYNVSLEKPKPNLRTLLNIIRRTPDYFGFYEISIEEAKQLMKHCKVNESLIID